MVPGKGLIKLQHKFYKEFLCKIYLTQENSEELLFSENYGKGCYLHSSNIQKDCYLTLLYLSPHNKI